jgi:hypothetical protein
MQPVGRRPRGSAGRPSYTTESSSGPVLLDLWARQEADRMDSLETTQLPLLCCAGVQVKL